MKFNLDELHWQEFEVLSFKILQILISNDVQFIEGGSDKGRDIVYEGKSKEFARGWSGKWVFQAKHKSKVLSSKELKKTILNDLKKELYKVFVKNKLNYNNYILITNKTINGTLFDQLNETFVSFKEEHNIECENFSIINYRHLESFIENSEKLKWMYPNIISHPDFNLLIQSTLNTNLENRKKGWQISIANQRNKFVYTQFFQKANDKLSKYPIIILSGPPKSGKTFNAEMLALNYSIFKNYQINLIDNPEEIERTYSLERKQIFICDDAFGKHALSLRADDWYQKLERILNLADKTHLFIFTSREYVFRSFINYGSETAKKFLEKIIVESHNYSKNEKLSILKRYTSLSKISDIEKFKILSKENELTDHKNFAPETIRAFFSNIETKNYDDILNQLKNHLDSPDEYLSVVFDKLGEIKKAALLAVLCTKENSEDSILNCFGYICNDLNINKLLNSKIEFDELDDSILRILKSDKIEEIKFYHPSMQEFLIKLLTGISHNKLREVVVKNINLTLLNISLIKPSKNSIFPTEKKVNVEMNSNDISALNVGISRLIEYNNTSIYEMSSILKWFKSDNYSIDLKMNDPSLFLSTKNMLQDLIKHIIKKEFYVKYKTDDCLAWSNLLFNLKNIFVSYLFDKKEFEFQYFKEILNHKKEEEYYWKVVFKVLSVSEEPLILNIVGKDWLNSFYSQLKQEIAVLGYELFGDDFPEFIDYNQKIQNKKSAEKLKDKPNSTWYPRFLIVREKIYVLKEVKGTNIGHKLLTKLTDSFNEIQKYEDYAKNRHDFIVEKGWW